jgi:hypothetical protein
MSRTSKTSAVKILIAFAATVMMFFGAACRQDEPETDIGRGYFPVEIGHWVVYEVDSTVYDDFEGDTDIYRYQVKELWESEFIDNQGRPAVRIERYKRWYDPSVPYDSIPWYLSRVWAFTRTNAGGEKLEENQRFLRVAFPVNEGRTWNGNAYNTTGEWIYKYREADEPFSIGAFAFDSTCLIEQKNEVNLINHRSYKERYAKNVGMIEKTVIDVHDTAFGPVPVINRIHDGVIYTIRLVDYGPR